MKFGRLDFSPVEDNFDLVAPAVKKAILDNNLKDVLVTKIDPDLADTAAFCDHYNIGMDVSANCVVVEAKRADKSWYAACMVLATTRADVNGIVRKQLDARKISFAPMGNAVALTKMEYGGITPIGLPADWPILIDSNVDKTKQIIIGSGIRDSKLLVPGHLLASLPKARVLDITKAN
ncbi:MAG TPA: YbaK/EbsC family protein [Candidatus Saccharimonadales bacterium]|nr:YbaK/EbsC family protein [Candidatus Saccharimonadales bacterium]